MSIWTLAFWKGAGERVLKTLVATTLAQLGAGVIAAVSGGTAPTAEITDYNWLHIASVDALAAIVSLGIALGNASFTAGAQAQQAAAELVLQRVAGDGNAAESTGPGLMPAPADSAALPSPSVAQTLSAPGTPPLA
jgi:hypothetical protein